MVDDCSGAADGGQPAAQLFDKLRAFVGELDDDERALFAALLAPGVAAAYEPDDDEVVGFASSWQPQRLPRHLAELIRDREVRITGLDTP